MSNSLEEKKSYFSNRVNLLVENIGTSLRDLLRQGADSSDWNEYAGNLELHLSIENISRDLEELLTLSFEIEVLTLEGNLPQVMSETDGVEAAIQKRIAELNFALEQTVEKATRALQKVSDYTPWVLDDGHNM
ncbi:hypothetical protein Gasu_35540 isoform 1 [Galdieria sulphuraria]|uniref:Uncharacterized protein n=1 Tax=Galdieria sulphuraria TaxID=130081 RepID=M2W044_GALSU|nr:hypothetical protein Gasu_35540 isoform 1 [Galdieria sulphuraria]EME28981.1 hypothetical protein isoform 1 [Galdieria sulphuraria]|eukprot:XP_005705501.1 hypothetical protein isoform 1 [Galdieria sulphuraria]